jgi:hypothetical protein
LRQWQQQLPQPKETTMKAQASKSQTPKQPALAAAGGKLGKVIVLLKRPKGATIADLTKATGWQAHSVRGAISGIIRKKLNFVVISEKVGDVRTYRIKA